jgi:hypothetical protein
MNYEPSTPQDWHILLEFTLDSKTWRITDEYLTLSDNTVYLPYLMNHSALIRSLGGILDPKLIHPQLSITVDNRNDVFATELLSNEFGNRSVDIKIGYGETAANYESVYKGIVKHPGGYSYDETFASLEIQARFNADDRNIPINKFFSSTYANVEAKSANLPIPLVYGSWLSTDVGGETVPCFCIDTTAGTGGDFKISDRELVQIEKVFKNGTEITAGNLTKDLANGEFEITRTDTYDPLTDTITANVEGATDNQTPTGNLLESLPDIADDILTQYMGVPTGNIDSTAFTAWGNELSISDYGRRVIFQESLASSYLTELLLEGFADLTIIADKYYPVYRVSSISSSIKTFYDHDIVDLPDQSKDFRIVPDKEKVFANDIVGRYRREYSHAEIVPDYKKGFDASDSNSITDNAGRRRRRLDLNWLYLQAGAEARVNREKFVFAYMIDTIVGTFRSQAVDLGPTDQFKLVYKSYDLGSEQGTPFMIRKTTTNFKRESPTVKFEAWSMLQMTPGRWTSNTAPDWSSSTALQRRTQGYWCNGSGLADPGDATSNVSIWF